MRRFRSSSAQSAPPTAHACAPSEIWLSIDLLTARQDHPRTLQLRGGRKGGRCRRRSLELQWDMVVLSDRYYDGMKSADPLAQASASGCMSPARFVEAMANSPLWHDGNMMNNLPCVARKARLCRSMGGCCCYVAQQRHRAASKPKSDERTTSDPIRSRCHNRVPKLIR